MNYDIFISHSSADTKEYVLPLCQLLEKCKITFWLDVVEVKWGDNIVDKMNKGIAASNYMLLCLSENFLQSNWTNAEFTSAYAIQNNQGQNKVLPLILNSREAVLKQYPLLSSIVYKEYSEGVDMIAQELTGLLKPDTTPADKGMTQICVESKYKGTSFLFNVPENASFKFLKDRVMNTIGLSESFDVGADMQYKIKWVMVDSRADADWEQLQRSEQDALFALLKNGGKVSKIYNGLDKISDYGLPAGVKFYLYAVDGGDGSGGGPKDGGGGKDGGSGGGGGAPAGSKFSGYSRPVYLIRPE